jgi:molybdate transport system substrate-binding protein
MLKTSTILAGSLILLGTLFLWFTQKDTFLETMEAKSPNNFNLNASPEIIVLCAASNQTVIELIRKEYEAETGCRVSLQFGSSQSLLAQLELSDRGDLFLPADDSYLTMAKQKNLVDKIFPIATMSIGVAVKKGNPKGIACLSDLIRNDVRLIQASPDSAAVGKITKSILDKSGQWAALNNATIAFRSTVTEVATDIQVSAADAGIVYAPVLKAFPELEFIALPELKTAISQVSVGVSVSTPYPEAALKFARYITSPDRGLKLYQAQGFSVDETSREELESMKKDDRVNETPADARFGR